MVAAQGLTVQEGAFVEINCEVMRACLEGFAKRGFSGDIVYRYMARQVLRTTLEIQVLNPAESHANSLESVEKHWERIAQWITHSDETLLTVRFQGGKITRVDVRNREQRWELNPTE